MTTLHESAESIKAALRELTVTSYSATAQGTELEGRKVNGYLLMHGRHILALIETLKPDPRVSRHLQQLEKRSLSARALMRTLLGAEDYTSDLYDNIVRIHYADEWAWNPGVPGNTLGGQPQNLPRPIGKRPELAADYGAEVRGSYAKAATLGLDYQKAGPIDWRRDAYETFDGKRYQK